MNQFRWLIAVLSLFTFGNCSAFAQTSLADLSGYGQTIALDWNNPALKFEFNLPPEPGIASLIIKADPMLDAPQSGSHFLLSINQHPAIPFAPIVRGFSARFDIPAKQLVAGKNNIELSFMPGPGRNCLTKPDGSWAIDMQLSRLDLALGRPHPSLWQFESWLAADIGAPSKIAIEQGQLSLAAYQEFGALIVQALSSRMNVIPQIIIDATQADLIVRPLTKSGIKPNLQMASNKSTATLLVSANNETNIIAASRWFASYQLPKQKPQGSLNTWPKIALKSSSPLQQILTETNNSAWKSISRDTFLRLPPAATARFRIEAHRPNLSDVKSQIQIHVDQSVIANPSLWRRVNNLSVLIPQSQSNARAIALSAKFLPKQANKNDCRQNKVQTRNTATRISLEMAGLDNLSDLDYLAWNGGAFIKYQGRNVQILLPDNRQALLQSWRVLAQLAKIGNNNILHAKFGGEPDTSFDLLAIKPRNSLPQQLINRLQDSFAKGAGHAPGDPYPIYRRPSISQSALANSPFMPAMGVAASTKLPNERVWLAISSADSQQLALALKDLVNGQALDYFSGTVLRWRGSKVSVNATNRKLQTSFLIEKSISWTILLLILFGCGLVSTLYLLLSKPHK